MAQFHWVSFIDELFAFMSSPIWRGCYVIVMGCFLFPHDNWDNIPWYYWVGWIVSVVVVVMGIIYLVTDLVACCQGGCKCPGGESGDLLDCAGTSGGSSRSSKSSKKSSERVVYSSK